jgi:hypothetical protein
MKNSKLKMKNGSMPGVVFSDWRYASPLYPLQRFNVSTHWCPKPVTKGKRVKG